LLERGGELLHLLVEPDEIAIAEGLRRTAQARVVGEPADRRLEALPPLSLAEAQPLRRDVVAQLSDVGLGLAFFHSVSEALAELLCVLGELRETFALGVVSRPDSFEIDHLL